MKRFHSKVISGWPALLLAPILVPVGVVAALWSRKRTQNLSAEDVSNYIRDFIEGTGGDWDWDHFESVRLSDDRLERIRIDACLAGPKCRRGDADFTALRALLNRAEKLAAADGEDTGDSPGAELLKRLQELPKPGQIESREAQTLPEPTGL